MTHNSYLRHNDVYNIGLANASAAEEEASIQRILGQENFVHQFWNLSLRRWRKSHNENVDISKPEGFWFQG